MKAYSLIRNAPWYRREAFARGLAAVGFEVFERQPDRANPGDVLVIWNRYGMNHNTATRFEREGGRVMVAENGYVGEGGTSPKFDVHPGGPKPHHYYALAWHGHNGQGEWPSGGPERLEALRLTLAPFRGRDGHLLVCPNRSFGIPGRTMPPDWAERAAARFRGAGFDVRIRRHPGNNAPTVPLSADLEGARAVAIWSSGAGVHALVAGIPVICDAPFWICKTAAITALESSAPFEDARRKALERMAWAQWQIREIESGAAFDALLRMGRDQAVPAAG